MVKATLEDLKINARDFSSIKKVTDTFVEWANKKLDEVEEIELQVCDSLPQVTKKRKKRQFLYETSDDPLDDPLHAFEVNVYNSIYDTIIQSISSRFESHGKLCADFACLDPNNFEVDVPLPTTALLSTHDKIAHFIPEITYDALRDEYTDFMSKLNELKKTIAKTMNTNNIMTQVKNLMVNIKLRVYYYFFKFKNYFVIIVLNF